MLDVAIALAGFTVGEAEGLRRAMSRKRSRAALEAHRARFVEGAVGKGVDEKVADLVYDKLVGFSGFGFPKSHAAAFGLLAYQSQWLRHHYPAEFLCALLNAQPMGFYPPASLVRDAQRRGVEVLSPDVNLSEAWCSLEPVDGRGLRCSHRARRRFGSASRTCNRWGRTTPWRSSTERDANGPYRDVGDLARRAPLSEDGLVALVEGGACDSFGPSADATCSGSSGSRRVPRSVPGHPGRGEAAHAARSPDRRDAGAPRPHALGADARRLPPTGLSVGIHPLMLLRPHLPRGTLSSAELHDAAHGARCRLRRPCDRAAASPTAKGSCSCCSRTSTAR